MTDDMKSDQLAVLTKVTAIAEHCAAITTLHESFDGNEWSILALDDSNIHDDLLDIKNAAETGGQAISVWIAEQLSDQD
jgi:hypothetical protein